MYLHLGQETVVRSQDIIGIFDMENASLSKYTKSFLAKATKQGQVFNVSYEMPKSFIVCREKEKVVVYISQISTQTLLKRARHSNEFHSKEFHSKEGRAREWQADWSESQRTSL